MAREYTDTLNTGECTFQITGANDIALRVMGKYMTMLDNVAASMGGSDLLNMDGLINFLLDDALNRNIKEIVKRHGFANSSDFFEAIADCKDGEEVKAVCSQRENERLIQMHEQILSQIPVEDLQQKLPL